MVCVSCAERPVASIGLASSNPFARPMSCRQRRRLWPAVTDRLLPYWRLPAAVGRAFRPGTESRSARRIRPFDGIVRFARPNGPIFWFAVIDARRPALMTVFGPFGPASGRSVYAGDDLSLVVSTDDGFDRCVPQRYALPKVLRQRAQNRTADFVVRQGLGMSLYSAIGGKLMRAACSAGTTGRTFPWSSGFWRSSAHRCIARRSG